MRDVRKAAEVVRNRVPSAHLAPGPRSKLLQALERIRSGDVTATDIVNKVAATARDAEFRSSVERLTLAVTEMAVRPSGPVDAVVLTALRDPELSEVLAWDTISSPTKKPARKEGLDELGWIPFSNADDLQGWYHARIPRWDGAEIQVVCGSPDQMGMVPMAVAATKALTTWSPSIIVLCGIAAGVQGKTNTGDILVPERVFVHDSGKWIDDSAHGPQLVRDPWTVMADSSLIQELKNTGAEIAGIVQARGLGTVLSAHRKLAVHTQALACGNAVMDSEEAFRAIVATDRKLTGLEMEAFAVLYAVRWTAPRLTSGVVIKAVSDHGVGKEDEYQQRASWISAQFALEYLSRSRAINWRRP